MELYTVNNLDNPVHYLPFKNLFNKRLDFYKDYYCVVYLDKTNTPIILDDPDLVELYGGYTLPTQIGQSILQREQVIGASKAIKLRTHVFFLSNKTLCIYYEKKYRWRGFEYTGIVTVFTNNYERGIKFYKKHVGLK